jgi:hypothetical protein
LRKEARLTRGPATSATGSGDGRRARRCWANGRDWARPTRRSEKKDGPRAGIEGGRAGGFAGLGRIPREDDFSFLFLFLIFQSKFSNKF